MVKNYPLVCLNMAFGEERVKQTGMLRPLKEITNNVHQAVEVLKRNPDEDYHGIRQERKGLSMRRHGKTYKVTRKSDEKEFAMKTTEGYTLAQRNTLINEVSLISFLEIDEMI